ncbi:LacI family transcriptional regulator [Modestobacter lapidis]|nr:LacI family transcriptional regulator [Modestobacter lapidis]
MSDVAARAGVSHQTVSRVVNGHPHVAPATRQRVQQAIEDLGYRPNTAARALVTGSTRTFGLVTSHINQYGPAQTLLGLEQAARAAGYSLSVAILDDDSEGAMREAVDRFVAQSVDAVLALSTYGQAVESLRRFEVPVPLIAVQVGRDERRPTVWVDQEAGAALATRHLLELGHRTVHHVAGPGDSMEARGRIVGWRRELLAAGAEVPEVLTGDWWPASGHAAGRELAARIRGRRAGEPAVTAVFLANDQMALGLLNALHGEGLTVPGDLSIVGFDDVPEAAYYTPPLTTVRQDFAELGRRGVELVLARLGGGDHQAEPVEPQLVVRSTTGPPPSPKGRREAPVAAPAGTRALAAPGRLPRRAADRTAGTTPVTGGRKGLLT